MDWKICCISPEASIQDTLIAINKAGEGFLVVSDNARHLLGVVTDGNIRRAILAGHTLNDPVTCLMQTHPRTVTVSTRRDEALRIMEDEKFSHLPVLDAEGRIVSLWAREELRSKASIASPMVLMVGGLGTRLGSLTRDIPKPMLPVGGRPMLEIIVRNCMDWGVRHFYMAVNYKARMVTDYFGDGTRFGCHIEYIRETKRMGTAGALSLLPERPRDTLLVSNGDILTHLNLRDMLTYHKHCGAVATMAVRKHVMHVPFGVVEHDADGIITGLREKPSHEFCVNAGVYALEPETLAHIPPDTFFDMPDLFTALLRAGQQPRIFENQNYWIDVGMLAEYQRAQMDFNADSKENDNS